MKRIKLLLATIVLFTSIETIHAQEEKSWVSGNSFNVSFPQGNLEGTYDHGFGIYANLDYNFNKVIAARFDLGWNDFSGPERSHIDVNGIYHVDHPNMSVWEFTAGLRAKISIFYVEARGGYFSGVNAWGVVPAIGLRMGDFDIQGNLALAGESHWSSLRLTYYWGKE